MSSRKARKRLSTYRKRPIQDVLTAAKKLAEWYPSLKKFKNRKTLTRHEAYRIALKETAMRGLYNLQKVTKRQADWLRKNDLLIKGQVHTTYKRGEKKGQQRVVTVGGIHAIQLSNTGESVKLEIVSDNLMVTTNGRTWVYQVIEQLPIDPEKFEDGIDDPEREENFDTNLENMNAAGKQAFKPTIREAFPIEKIIKLAEKAFKNPTVKMVGLWTTKGRAGEVFANFKEFTRWVYRDFSSYSNVERWVNGIAALIADVGDTIPMSAWRKGTKGAKAARARRRRMRLKAKRARA